MTFVKTIKKESYAVVVLDRGKVNAINHAMVKEIRQTFQQLEMDDEIRGAIITGKPHYFSAGLDVIELYDYDYDQIQAFWLDFLGMMIDLTKFSKPMIAAISGHSPAGGAIIAITADWRLMAMGEKYLIGLNEVAVGINITSSIFNLYSFWLGKRQAYHALLAGQLFNVNHALEIGLVDQAVELDALVEEAENKLKKILRANDHILRTTKKCFVLTLSSKLTSI
ncbi:MAG: enoyl-CoA hydratase/isomerase family protein [Saprospiraceae bacterium]|nr:enoyl-CoA hydratase/isomerase family protein [Saprospiraceae bacterium]